jgi:heme o synthase
MKESSLYSHAITLPRSRFADYLELAKPRVALLVLFTVAAGGLLACRSTPDMLALVHTLAGTALVAAGASTLNQFLERHTDAAMRRTENRPLPSGRLQPFEVLLLGLGFGVGGLLYLVIALRQPLCLLVAGTTFVSYVFLYTPLKRKTTLNTLVGAIPGALPPLIGWTALGGGFDAEAVALFCILFLWQVPHFLAIAWIYRDDYARAGLQMLPVLDDTGAMTGRQMVSYCLALIPVSLLPVLLRQAGMLYTLGALIAGAGFLTAACGFLLDKSNVQARRVLHMSLLYLPVIFSLLLLERGLSLSH